MNLYINKKNSPVNVWLVILCTWLLVVLERKKGCMHLEWALQLGRQKRREIVSSRKLPFVKLVGVVTRILSRLAPPNPISSYTFFIFDGYISDFVSVTRYLGNWLCLVYNWEKTNTNLAKAIYNGGALYHYMYKIG